MSPFLGRSRIAWSPPPSSSLAEEERLCSLYIARSARGGWRLLAAALLTRSQTKGMSARSLVQDSGAPAWLRTAARDFPTLTPEEPASAAAAKGNDCDQAEDEDDT
jgi:hypothetical protein